MDVHFVVIGAGGLGCPALLGLHAAGARRVTIIDDDRVELSNLPRQVLFATADVGAAKVDAARWSLLERTAVGADAPTLTTLHRHLDPAQLPALLDELCGAEPCVVLECSDSPRLKFAVHDACVAKGVGVVIGGVLGWRGQAMAVDPRQRDAACYRCLFEAPPPPELAPACATAGVVGAVAGALGHAVAMLAVGLAAQLDSQHPDSQASPERAPPASPAGTCVNFDLLSGRVRQIAPAPRPDCPTCRRNFETGPT
ncbi:Molybdopterin-synthase adenylyltransferase [Enhygromyxa salina]|uniref:Molybdopterin-synthase adenylyltransferase n=1 Tax=Enhygromyxa salina TaxID=215803 RepID=A0A2S9XAQ9_9BACT|nr:ThiF family adenylyltransferase [Enhygromyxa salina]PRP89938.1 Molybdopterin-synthase adenylyltransferase [Enhygromyxa salina]